MRKFIDIMWPVDLIICQGCFLNKVFFDVNVGLAYASSTYVNLPLNSKLRENKQMDQKKNTSNY